MPSFVARGPSIAGGYTPIRAFVVDRSGVTGSIREVPTPDPGQGELLAAGHVRGKLVILIG